jgi:hypothetical protein
MWPQEENAWSNRLLRRKLLIDEKRTRLTKTLYNKSKCRVETSAEITAQCQYMALISRLSIDTVCLFLCGIKDMTMPQRSAFYGLQTCFSFCQFVSVVTVSAHANVISIMKISACLCICLCVPSQ